MDDQIQNLYRALLDLETKKLGLDYDQTKYQLSTGISQIREAYSYSSLVAGTTDVDFNDLRNRMAYFYMYAIAHTKMAESIFYDLTQTPLKYWLQQCKNTLNICSIGGGPGIDVVGIVLALKSMLIPLTINATIIDRCEGWKEAYFSLVDLLGEQHINFSRTVFVRQDLCEMKWKEEVNEEIKRADIIVMMKFISAVASNNEVCENLLKKIFTSIKPESIVLAIDNSNVNLLEILHKTASSCGLLKVCRPVVGQTFPNLVQINFSGIFCFVKKELDIFPLKSPKIFYSVFQKQSCEQDSTKNDEVENVHAQIASNTQERLPVCQQNSRMASIGKIEHKDCAQFKLVPSWYSSKMSSNNTKYDQ
ncbi:uncharacterized protein LOC106468769 [Limulus polyphemus]|uniref:Uncharacterized protein LOC106468769 n=1 Tax=Limulus polyphemus TaxID=6850 RepID=A0ABM1BLY6_LIMPO|nr:uncharacterized protein LOC106468769 [Limulus polyphemus]